MCFNYNLVVCHLLSTNFDFRYGANGRMHIYVRICGAQTNTTTSYRRAACWGLPRQTDETPARPINHANNKRIEEQFRIRPSWRLRLPISFDPMPHPRFQSASSHIPAALHRHVVVGTLNWQHTQKRICAQNVFLIRRKMQNVFCLK